MALVAPVVPVPAPSAVPAPVAPPPRVCGGPGTGEDVIRTSDGQDHTYHWRVPSTKAPSAGRPVLIWLHPLGGDGTAVAASFWHHSDPDGAIVVTPDGTGRSWNRRADDGAGPLDAQFLERLIDLLRDCDGVDRTRVYLGGRSMGGFMTYHLLQRPGVRDKVAATVVVAGHMVCNDVAGPDDVYCSSVTSPELHTSAARMLHIHGTADAVVPNEPTAAFHDPVVWGVDWRVFFPIRLWAQQHACFDDEVGGANNGVLRETFEVDGLPARLYDLTGHGPACDAYRLILVEGGGHGIQGLEGRIWAFLTGRPVRPPKCGGKVATIVGTPGPDVLRGTPGPDVIVGRGGNDVIRGRRGRDVICGGPGRDRLMGGPGRDRLLAKDGRADGRIDCGRGRDPAARRDPIDPRGISCG